MNKSSVYFLKNKNHQFIETAYKIIRLVTIIVGVAYVLTIVPWSFISYSMAQHQQMQTATEDLQETIFLIYLMLPVPLLLLSTIWRSNAFFWLLALLASPMVSYAWTVELVTEREPLAAFSTVGFDFINMISVVYLMMQLIVNRGWIWSAR